MPELGCPCPCCALRRRRFCRGAASPRAAGRVDAAAPLGRLDSRHRVSALLPGGAALTLCAPRRSRPRAQDRATIKAERLAARTGKQAVVVEDDPLAAQYGDTPLVQSQAITGRVWTRLAQLTPDRAGQTVLVRGRVHAVRGKGKSAFLILRQGTSTLQARLPHAAPTAAHARADACALRRWSCSLTTRR